VEYASSFWPVTIESASFEESVTFFEQEVIFDELFLILSTHITKRVVFSSEFALEAVASLNNLLLNLISLCSGYSWSQGEFGEVTTYTDPCASNHLCVFWWESRAVEF